MPAWQKRQPWVQPRWISTAARSWTVWRKGTIGLTRAGGSFSTMRRPTTGRDAGFGGLERRGSGRRRRSRARRTRERRCRACAARSRRRSRAGRAVALPIADELGDLDDGVFALAEDEGIDEGRERLGVEGAAAAGDDERVIVGALVGPDGDAGEVEHVEDVGVGHLVLEREAEDVELADAMAGLEAPERDAVGDASRVPCRPTGRRRARRGRRRAC